MTYADKVLAEGTITTALLVKASETVATDNTPYEAAKSTQAVNIYFSLDVDRFNVIFIAGKEISNK